MMYCSMLRTFTELPVDEIHFVLFSSRAIYLIAKKGETPLKTRNNKKGHKSRRRSQT